MVVNTCLVIALSQLVLQQHVQVQESVSYSIVFDKLW